MSPALESQETNGAIPNASYNMSGEKHVTLLPLLTEAVSAHPLLLPALELHRTFNSGLKPNSDEDSETMDTETDPSEEIEFNPLDFVRTLPRDKPDMNGAKLHMRTRRTRRVTLVLDLDETLIHSEQETLLGADDQLEMRIGAETCTVFVRYRPFVLEFLHKVNQLFEVVLFTAGLQEYADGLLRTLDPDRRLLRHRYYRDSCTEVNGVFVKDISALGRDMSRVVIVDNSLHAFGYHIDNGILIQSWYEDQTDTALRQLWEFLETEIAEADDVRMVLQQFFGLSRLLVQ